MATTTVTLTGDAADAIGVAFDARRTKVYVRHNTDTVVTDSGPIRLGGGSVTPATDGTFELPDVVASTSLVENLQATLVVDYPDKTAKNGRGTATFGPYDLTGLTGTVDIRTLEAVQYLDASRASALLTEMQELHDATAAIAGADTAGDLIAAVDLDSGSDFRIQQDARLADSIAAGIAAATLVSVTNTYTLLFADAGKLIKANKATAFTVTIPPEVSVAFPVGTVISGIQYGLGQITVAPGSGVTLLAPNGTKSIAQYARFDLLKTAADEWLLDGALTT